VLAEIECRRCQVTDLTQLLTSHVLKIQNIGCPIAREKEREGLKITRPSSNLEAATMYKLKGQYSNYANLIAKASKIKSWTV